jgi:hypothetical protein
MFKRNLDKKYDDVPESSISGIKPTVLGSRENIKVGNHIRKF